MSGWGTRPARLGPVLIVLGALVGMILTVLAGERPGPLLGLVVVAATVAGGTAVRAESVYLTIPFPAPAYFIAAVISGLIHDRALDTSNTALALNFTRWIAGGFLWMLTATIAAMAITVIRVLMTGQLAYRLGSARNSRRTDRDFWAPQGRQTVTRDADRASRGDSRHESPVRSGRPGRNEPDS